MNQTEKRIYLIRSLLQERPRFKSIEVPVDPREQRDLLRSLMNVRAPAPLSDAYLKIESEYLLEETRKKGITKLSDLTPVDRNIYLWQGDITTLACDAIVNAANSQLLGCFLPLHNCEDNCVHSAAGLQLRNYCDQLMKEQGHAEPTGQAKITPAFNLPSKFVIHTVGPIVNGPLTTEHCELLASSYRNCLEIAARNGCRNIAFCCISTGVFGFPQREAAQIAIDTVKTYQQHSEIAVIFNVFKNEDLEIYNALLNS